YYLVVTARGGGFTRTYDVPVTVSAGGGGGGAPQSSPFTVNTNSDAPNDPGCTDTDCTLREAIDAANIWDGAASIQFGMPSAAIALNSALPPITNQVAVLGGTQTG